MKLFRERIRQQFGTAFASKASDRVCRKLCKKDSAAFRSFYLKNNVISQGVIVETIDTFSVKPAMPVTTKTGANDDLEARRKIRMDFAQAWKSVILNTIGDVSSELIVKSQLQPKNHPAGVCWSNASVLTYADFNILAEVAQDPLVSLIDLPDPIKREIIVTGKTTGMKPFRKQTSLTGKGVIVALVDGEVHDDHPYLLDRIRRMSDYSGEGWGKPDWHATAVAGIVGSSHAEYSGMAPEAIIHNYKAFPTKGKRISNDHPGCRGIDSAIEDGAEIINLSWGGKRTRARKSREARSCDTAWEIGIVVVKSAGNKGRGPNRLTIPAEADGIIVVGATDRECLYIPDYSSGGKVTDHSFKPHLVAPGGIEDDGEGIFSCGIDGSFCEPGFGTSFSAPHVSGLIALLLQQNRLSPDDVRKVLMEDHCVPLPGFPKWAQGAGVIQMF